MSRQQRRAQARAESKGQRFHRVHGAVVGSLSIRDVWDLYFKERFAEMDLPDGSDSVLQEVFYSGAAAMLELTMRVSEDDITEDRGAEMIGRLHDELAAYVKGLGKH